MILSPFFQKAIDINERYEIIRPTHKKAVKVEVPLNLQSEEGFNFFLDLFKKSKYEFYFFVKIEMDFKKSKFDIDEKTDVLFKINVNSALNLSMDVWVGELSDCWADKNKRAEFFNIFFKCIEKDTELKAVIKDDDVNIENLTAVFQELPDDPYLRITDDFLLKRPCLYSLKWSTNLKIYGISFDEIEKNIKSIFDTFGWEKIYITNLSFMSTLDNYKNHVFPILQQCPSKKFKYWISGKPRKLITNLDELKNMQEDFLVDAFTITPKGCGKLYVSLEKVSENYIIEFKSEYKNERQRKSVEKFVLHLFDNEDLIDWEVIS